MSASQDFSWVDKKLELSSAVYLAYLSAVSIDKNPRTRGKSWRKIDEEACPDVIDCVSSLVQAREAADPHWFTGSDVIRCGSAGSSLVSSEMSPWGIGQLLPAGRIGKMSFREDDPVKGGRKFEADRHSTLLARHVQPWHYKITIVMHPALLNLFSKDYFTIL
jgi:hypothetical protein